MLQYVELRITIVVRKVDRADISRSKGCIGFVDYTSQSFSHYVTERKSNFPQLVSQMMRLRSNSTPTRTARLLQCFPSFQFPIRRFYHERCNTKMPHSLSVKFYLLQLRVRLNLLNLKPRKVISSNVYRPQRPKRIQYKQSGAKTLIIIPRE